MLAVRSICKPGRARRDGTSVIFIQYCLNSQKRILLNSGIAIPSKFWNKRILKVSALLERQFGEPNELNRQIRDMVRNVEELIELATNLKVDNLISFLKDNFQPYPDLKAIEKEITFKKKEEESQNPHLNFDLYFQIDDYISSKMNLIFFDFKYAFSTLLWLKLNNRLTAINKLPFSFEQEIKDPFAIQKELWSQHLFNMCSFILFTKKS